MSKLRKQSIAIGILIICTFIFGILSIEQSIDSKEYLSIVAENMFSVKVALVSQLLLAFTYLAIAVLIFSVISKYDLEISCGYLVFKSTSQVFNILGTMFIIAFITLSKEYGENSPENLSMYVLVGDLLKSARDYANHVIMILLNNIGILIFSFIALRYKIIPRWISLLGIFGALVSGFASVLVLFDLMDVLTTEYLLLNVPIAVQDLILATFLIIYGFKDFELGANDERKAGRTKVL